ncbi:MAG: hypothetical protein DSY35_01685, partial [Desulfurobacterium sp.]
MRGKGALVRTLLVASVSCLFILLAGEAEALEVYPVIFLENSSSNSDPCKKKHCNWIEIDKNSGFQIAVECDAKEKEKCGKVYVDRDGDGKVDIEFLPSGAVLILPKGEERKGISKWIKLDEKKPYRIAFTCKSEENCSEVYVDKNGDGIADEIKFSSGWTFVLNNPQQPQKTKSEFTPPELPYCRIIRADG